MEVNSNHNLQAMPQTNLVENEKPTNASLKETHRNKSVNFLFIKCIFPL
jgi:hypothetical protein